MALFRFARLIDRPPAVLGGDGLYLRPAEAQDYRAWSALRAESRAFLEPWEPVWPDDDLTRAAFRRRVKRYEEEAARGEAFPFLIFRAGDHRLLGGVTLGQVRRGVAQTGTLGYWMGARHAGKGHMTRAVASVCRFGFSALRLHRIEAACLPRNAPSRRLLERNGFVREGYAREYLRINGAWEDHLLFASVNPADASRRSSAEDEPLDALHSSGNVASIR